MKPNFNLFPVLLLCAVWSCKKEPTLSEYKFADKEMVIKCGNEDSTLFNEALYAFEDDINSFYTKNSNSPNRTLPIIYSQFLRNYGMNRVNYEDLVTPHTLEVFNILKTRKDLWNPENSENRLNYYGSFFGCIAENVQDKNLKPTLNALMSTHSMSTRMFSAPLLTQYTAAANDKYLSTYIAFDLFYAKLFDIDTTKVKEREIDFNQTSNSE